MHSGISLLNWSIPIVLSIYSKKSDHETPADKLTRLFHELTQNDTFSREWEQVNANLHKPIRLIASPPEGDQNHQKFAAIRLTKCPPGKEGCSLGSEKSAHGFNMYVNADPATSESEVKFSIIFEMYNVRHWPEHLEITEKAKTALQEENAEELAVQREEVEWKVLQDAKELAASIDSKIFDKTLYPWEDFASYLRSQRESGHFSRAKQQIEKLMVSGAAHS